MKLLSVIIVTYNSQDIIEKCLNHLFKYNDIGKNLEVIIVDNSGEESNKILFNLLEKKFSGQLKLIKNNHNGGYGQGNNLGIKNSIGKYISIMNPDVILTEPLFKVAIRHFECKSDLAMMGFKQYGGLNLSIYFRPEFYLPFLTSIFTKIFNRLDVFNKKFMFLSGAFLFVEKEAFEKIGLFDENIFLYVEESDIMKRFLKEKFDIVYDNSKSYLHEINERKEMSNSSYKTFIESSGYYLNKFSFSKVKFLNFLKIELLLKKYISILFLRKESAQIFQDQIKIINNS